MRSLTTQGRIQQPWEFLEQARADAAWWATRCRRSVGRDWHDIVLEGRQETGWHCQRTRAGLRLLVSSQLRGQRVRSPKQLTSDRLIMHHLADRSPLIARSTSMKVMLVVHPLAEGPRSCSFGGLGHVVQAKQCGQYLLVLWSRWQKVSRWRRSVGRRAEPKHICSHVQIPHHVHDPGNLAICG